MIVDKINQYLNESGKEIEEAIAYEVGLLAQWAFRRQFMSDEKSESKGNLRLSACGKCPRSLGYSYHGFEQNGKVMDARSKFTFFAGDVVEISIVQVAKTALKKLGGGCLVATGRDQATIKLPVNGSMITGHPDGMFLADKKTYLLECKSFSSFGFKKFEMGQIDDAYIAQANAYMEALGLDKVIFIGYNKDSNVLHEIVMDKNEEVVKKIRENMKAVLHSTPENLPEPAYEKDDQGFYPWQCLYCAYWGHCRTNAEKVLVKNSYKLKEKQNGNGVSGQAQASGEQDNQVGSGVCEVPTTGRKPRRTKKDDTVI